MDILQTDSVKDNYSVILFDGVCNLCNNTVDFILSRDKGDNFRFASLQSKQAEKLLGEFEYNNHDLSTFVLIENNKLYTRSDAALRVFKKLGYPWRILYILILMPRPLRDFIYRFAANNRYRWFGKRNTCRLPDKTEINKFLS